jgi:C4-dicarboxylate-specific signal transduction histidine kinase
VLSLLMQAQFEADGLLSGVPLGDDVADIRKKAEALSAVLQHATSVAHQMMQLVDPPQQHGHSTDLRELISKLEPIIRPAVERVGLLAFDLGDTDVPVGLAAYRAVQVVTALIGDAVERLASGDRYDGHIQVSLTKIDEYAELVVRDDRPSLDQPKRVQTRRAIPLATREPSSPELHLPLVHSQARAAGGDLYVAESADGTERRVLLPLIRAETD